MEALTKEKLQELQEKFGHLRGEKLYDALLDIKELWTDEAEKARMSEIKKNSTLYERENRKPTRIEVALYHTHAFVQGFCSSIGFSGDKK